MQQKEIEVALSELEDRLDRLRAAYEQYFMGFEKIEPGVQRKDVERRFAQLRKIQIRNTALRFRFNVATQKWNTYAMYWARICRQIEEGTYKRHIQRAKRRFGEGPVASRHESDHSIEVELGDFEDLSPEDLDAVLAEADAAASKYQRDDHDTIPPPGDAPASSRAAATPPSAASNRSEVIEDPPSTRGPMRAARPVALPTGAKPRVIRRIGQSDAPPPPSDPQPQPPSVRPSPVARPLREGETSPASQGLRVHRPAAAPRSVPIIRPAAPSAARVPLPSGGQIPAAPPNAEPDTASERGADSLARPSQPQTPVRPSQPQTPVRPSQPQTPVRPKIPLPLPSQQRLDEKGTPKKG